MKKIYLLFFVLLSSLNTWCQTSSLLTYEGNLTIPDNEKYVKLDFDFSQTVFEKKYNEEDWALLNGKNEWEEAKQEALERIVDLMNEKMKNTRINLVIDKMIEKMNNGIVPKYTLYITPLKLKKNGKNTSAFVLKNNATGEVLGTVQTVGKGAHFGSLGNMLGDGLENSGPVVAKLIRKHNKIKK